MLKDLEGMKVLITESSTGIGAALARGFAQAGAKVAVHGFANAAAAEALAREIGGTAVVGDVTRTAATERLVKEAGQALGGLDCLINNADGLVKRAPLGESGDELIDEVLDLNIRSVVVASRAALPLL